MGLSVLFEFFFSFETRSCTVRATQVTRTEILRALNYLPGDSLYGMRGGMAMGEIASTDCWKVFIVSLGNGPNSQDTAI